MNISYFLKYWRVLGDTDIALAYMVTMLTDAIIAVPIRALYDKIKFKSLYLAPLSALTSTLLFIYTPTLKTSILQLNSVFLSKSGVSLDTLAIEAFSRIRIASDIIPVARSTRIATEPSLLDVKTSVLQQSHNHSLHIKTFT